jgi:di/tripeptidase
MEDRKLQRLKEVLSVPTYSRQEDLMIEYLERVLIKKGYDYKKDSIGNIYVTKGQAEYFPCFVAHTDTVHSINHNLKVVQLEEEGKTILTGIDSKTMRPSGIGGDDKCGVFLCLEMLDTLDNVKVALFVSEEIGCVGSRQADHEFFESDFGNKVSGLILEHGIDDWARHPYTDIWPLMEKFNFSCLNLAAGYHRYHTDNEYVVVEEVQNGFELGLKLHQELGENFYERPEKKEVEKSYFWGGYGSSNKQIITEDEEEDDDLYYEEEEGDGFIYDEDDELDIIDTSSSYKVGEFEDFWDYEDFNGGYTIKNYSNQKDSIDFDW